jgi:hypothetical protein
MDKAILNDAVAKGLPMPFSATMSGDTIVADVATVYQEQIVQMATVIFETISAVGEVKIEKIELMGSKKGIILDLNAEGLVGTVVEPPTDLTRPELWQLLQELREKPASAPAARRMAIVDAAVLQDIKAILHDYVGDFTERIFQNQLRNQNIKLEELHEEDVRRVILALTRATSMIVGRSKGRELSKRLIELVK